MPIKPGPGGHRGRDVAQARAGPDRLPRVFAARREVASIGWKGRRWDMTASNAEAEDNEHP